MPINEVFGFADKDSNDDALDLSSQIRFVTLNTETSVAGDQAKWLDEELQRSRGNHRWLLASCKWNGVCIGGWLWATGLKISLSSSERWAWGC